MNEAKQTLRGRALAVRRALPPEFVAEAGESLARHALASVPLIEAPEVLAHLASKDNEAPTVPLIAALQRRGVRVLVPRMAPGHCLEWAEAGPPERWIPNRYGILEPAGPAVASAPEAPVVAPGLAWTRSGIRLGYGGGYYDRFFAGHRGPRIGWGYACQLVATLPEEPHDRRMDWLVTETGGHSCAAQ